jgi:hypothetical protein
LRQRTTYSVKELIITKPSKTNLSVLAQQEKVDHVLAIGIKGTTL